LFLSGLWFFEGYPLVICFLIAVNFWDTGVGGRLTGNADILGGGKIFKLLGADTIWMGFALNGIALLFFS
jgi:hypothetical protein